jgi:hypothetical protein
MARDPYRLNHLRAAISSWFDAGVELRARYLLVLEGLLGRAAEPLYVYDPTDSRCIDAGIDADPSLSLGARWRNRTVIVLCDLSHCKELQTSQFRWQKPFNLYVPEGVVHPTLPPGAFPSLSEASCPVCGK